jgi:nitrate reductase beta subunit
MILKVNEREKKSYKKYFGATDDFFLYLRRICGRNINPSCSIKMWVRNEAECKNVETEV